MEEKIPEIVLTGGPCGGKTTGLAYLSEKLQDRGFRVFLVPEIATMLIKGGVCDIAQIARANPRLYLQIEKQMIWGCLSLRHLFRELARVFEGEKRVIIYDRGAMDCAAYMTPEQFQAVLEDSRLTLFEVRDSYDAAIHLVTAAKGAEKFYTRANNEARLETLGEARLADDKTLAAWTGHSHLKIIDNSTDFETKMKRLLQAACRVLGIPVPLEIERKFLLKSWPDLTNSDIDAIQKVSIEQIYIIDPRDEHNELRIRKRSQNGYSTYYKTRKTRLDPETNQALAPDVRQERENVISAEDYVRLKDSRDPGTDIIRKHRHCFVYKHQYFELDVFIEPPRLDGLCLLEIELTEENDRVELPPFLEIEREVSGDPAYTNYGLSRKDD